MGHGVSMALDVKLPLFSSSFFLDFLPVYHFLSRKVGKNALLCSHVPMVTCE